MPRAVVTAFGPDRPGIVAAVTGVLVEHGANLADTAMTDLAGQFAMVLVVDLPADEVVPALEAALAAGTRSLGLTVTVRPLDDDERPPEVATDVTAWSVSVYGADQPGIVHRVTTVLAASDANIVDLTTRVIGTPDDPVYVMLLQVALPPGAAIEELRAALDVVAAEIGVEVHLRPDEADIL